MSKIVTTVFSDRLLKVEFSGIILCGVVMIALLITAGVLFT
jgi:hypothetical protein